jgi:hypothetical protein
MIIRVELHSAITGQITEIEPARIANIGRSETLGNYATEMLRSPCAEDLNKGMVQRSSFSEKHPRKARHIWHLVAKALKAIGVWRTKRRSTENKLIDIAAELRHETQAAHLLADGAREASVPKSQVEDNGDWTYTMRSWLAKDRGLRDE